MKDPLFAWEILNQGAFLRGGAFMDRSAPRLYLSRERAEAVALGIAEIAHESAVGDHVRGVGDPDREEYYTEEEDAWWLSRPPLTVHRTDDRTFYCCGDPEWDSRDRRGEAYGWVVRREVVR